jgi:hypothetical protein
MNLKLISKNIKLNSFIETELFISISLLLIITLFSIVGVNKICQKINFENEVMQLKSDIEYIRSLALIKKETLRMEFFGSSNYYRFETDNYGLGIASKFVERRFDSNSGFPVFFDIQNVSYIDENGNLVQGSINLGGNQHNSYALLKFYPDGTPSTGGHIVLYSKQLKKCSAIIIKPVTGRCRVGKVIINF